ncbi:hypothetical protein MNB_SV-8-1341 [hydrothermal vent metagenome]|uniref:Uncharacterized protein n=1 Tax=hydrothermal vent metagenome TaxID=652676 RepID=A0A1W1BGB5_9ZZZZ
MNNKIKEMIEEIEEKKQKLREEIEKQEKHIDFEIRNGYVIFEKDVLARQRKNMKNLLVWFSEIPLFHLLSAPIVYAMIIPALFLDGMLFIYKQVVSRVFKFEFAKRSDYVVFDRQYLGYLNIIEKLNCIYCSYFNGLMCYASMIASRTELYFCPIKHAKKVAYKHAFYDEYLLYGDGDEYQKKLKELRKNSEQR